MFQNFQTICETMELWSVSVPDTRGLNCVHVMSFFELGFFLIAVSMIGCLGDEFGDGKPHLRAMIVHVFASSIEIN